MLKRWPSANLCTKQTINNLFRNLSAFNQRDTQKDTYSKEGKNENHGLQKGNHKNHLASFSQ